MDIDLRLLKQVEADREISFAELVQIIEEAVVAAYHRHVGNHDPARAVLGQALAATAGLAQARTHCTVRRCVSGLQLGQPSARSLAQPEFRPRFTLRAGDVAEACSGPAAACTSATTRAAWSGLRSGRRSTSERP